MRAPLATYRLQFNSSFGFQSARRIVSYLARLGISDIYASPIFKARKNSPHGYDVTDPNTINPEVGSAEDFEALIEAVHNEGMGWVQDFVPNHMAYDSDNHMLMDLFEKGRSSIYFDFFDVVWDHLRENLRGKLIAPFLGKPYGEALESGEIQLQYAGGRFEIRYYETVYPLRIESYASVLERLLDFLKERLGEDSADYLRMLAVVHVIKNLPQPSSEDEGRNAQIQFAKDSLLELYQKSPAIQGYVNESVSIFNRNVDVLDELIGEQWFRLTYWRVATKEINYQRFFNINELISLRMEEEAVFDQVHELALGLLNGGKIDGLRIDHVDGLYDPTAYLIRLRERAGDAFIVVEKILELAEKLPSRWPVEGTTGYEFMNYLNELFVEPENGEKFQRVYSAFAGSHYVYEDLLVEKKKLLIDRHLTGDLDNLTYVMKQISITTRHGIDLTWIGLKRALTELSAVFPVYRTYFDGNAVTRQDRAYVEQAIDKARWLNADLARELDFIEKVLWLDYPPNFPEAHKRLWYSFGSRFQQFTSPLMAKGLEDTTFYVFNRLVSLNEVGGNPARFGIPPEEFHTWNMERLRRHPHTLNATATHDTKRGEDVRARINLLSEMPEEWERHLSGWHEMNRRFKREVAGEEAPEKNSEYFLYQTLIGAYPFDRREGDDFVERIKSYMVKASREAKVHTFWQDPNSEYEEALLAFTEAVLEPGQSNAFLRSFLSFQKKIAQLAVFGSLSQTLLKVTSPGVPDFYQGSELWDLNLVDPDNRRPVDYEKRERLLEEIIAKERAGTLPLVSELLSSSEDGRIKLYTIYKAIGFRRKARELFERGEYIPLRVTGAKANNVLAFARRNEKEWAAVIAPRLIASLVEAGATPVGDEVWRDTTVELPEGAPATWRNIFTGDELSGEKRIEVAGALKDFPAGLLAGSY